MALKPLPRLLLIVTAVAGAWVGINRYTQYAHANGVSASTVPGQADVPVAGSTSAAAQPALAVSTLAPATGGYTARTLLALTLPACAYWL